ncbi:MAG: Ubiquinone biosynthesis O-methyltransferase [Candidatus Scalindua rubra]|uniref:Ubiquinone biosynthesis O-methyltransferase n=1 Tax=Candidatus Scalindua rubra TaxID=1872076 RepID=A0A1E3XG51_9BACT|nr:MAG: Ubiquinone biosynthesis O-methyltransferase [Candidatus Scalindua rubra]
MSKSVKTYFNRTAAEFDSLYSDKRNKIFQIIDRLLRSDIYKRFALTFLECQPVEGSSILDVGCGSGRYAVEFARRGADEVVGIEFAKSMIELAVFLAGDMGVKEKCEFIQGDFLQMQLDRLFDYSLALGVFDYTENAETFLQKMKSLTKQKIIASFPRNTFLRSSQRRIRYRIMGCPVYFYGKEDVKRILMAAGLTKFRITELQGDYFVIVPMDDSKGMQ